MIKQTSRRSAKPGRPKKDSLSNLRTMAWFNAVSQASGMNAYELDIFFAGRYRKYENRACIWDKYERGEVEPRTKTSAKGQPSIVQKVEKKFPGTAEWLKHPIWTLLGNSRMNMEEIRSVYMSLNPRLRALFIMDTSTARKPGIFWRRDMPLNEIFQKLEKGSGLDSLTALLAMIKEAEITQYQDQHIQALLFWNTLSPKIRSVPALAPLRGPLNEIIQKKMLRCHYRIQGKSFRFKKSNGQLALA